MDLLIASHAVSEGCALLTADQTFARLWNLCNVLKDDGVRTIGHGSSSSALPHGDHHPGWANNLGHALQGQNPEDPPVRIGVGHLADLPSPEPSEHPACSVKRHRLVLEGDEPAGLRFSDDHLTELLAALKDGTWLAGAEVSQGGKG